MGISFGELFQTLATFSSGIHSLEEQMNLYSILQVFSDPLFERIQSS